MPAYAVDEQAVWNAAVSKRVDQNRLMCKQ
jgi:hypothetical protein